MQREIAHTTDISPFKVFWRNHFIALLMYLDSIWRIQENEFWRNDKILQVLNFVANRIFLSNIRSSVSAWSARFEEKKQKHFYVLYIFSLHIFGTPEEQNSLNCCFLFDFPLYIRARLVRWKLAMLICDNFDSCVVSYTTDDTSLLFVFTFVIY